MTKIMTSLSRQTLIACLRRNNLKSVIDNRQFLKRIKAENCDISMYNQRSHATFDALGQYFTRDNNLSVRNYF